MLYVCETMIRRLDEMSLVRRPNEHGVNVLQAADAASEVQAP